MTNGSPGPQRVALYVRVSSEAQTEKYGLDAQLAAVCRRAAERGYLPVPDGERDAFADDGYSGENLQRPAMEQLRQVVRDGRADVVLAHDPDRLSRSLTDLLLLADEFEGKGVRMEFITGEFDASPEGRLFFSIRGAVAEFEKAKIRERMMRGKREKADQGLVVNPANLPAWLRWDLDAKQVVLDAHWADVLSLIFRLFVDDGLTLRAVARRLTDLGYQTPSGGAHWQPTTVQAWLRNPAAKGEYCQFRMHSAEPKRRPKPVVATARRTPRSSQVDAPPEEWSRIPVPAPVGAASRWDAAQQRLAQNKALASRNAHRFYLLSGLAICGECGRRMVGVYKTRTGRRYYQCGHRGSLTRVDGSGACMAPYANADRLEEQVWERVQGLLLDPDQLRAEFDRRRAADSPTRETLDSDLRKAQGRLAEVPAEMDRLVEGYGKGLIPDDRMRERMTALQQERTRLQGLAAAAEQDLLRLEADAEAQDGAVAFAERMRDRLQDLDDEGRREVLRLVVREVLVHRDRIIIRTVLGSGEPNGGGHSPDRRLCSHASLLAGLARRSHRRGEDGAHVGQHPAPDAAAPTAAPPARHASAWNPIPTRRRSSPPSASRRRRASGRCSPPPLRSGPSNTPRGRPGRSLPWAPSVSRHLSA